MSCKFSDLSMFLFSPRQLISRFRLQSGMHTQKSEGQTHHHSKRTSTIILFSSIISKMLLDADDTNSDTNSNDADYISCMHD